MQYGDYQQGMLIWGVSNQIITYIQKTSRPGGQIGPLVAVVRKSHEPLDGAQDFFAHSSGCKRVSLRDEIPNVLDVLGRFWVKLKAVFGAHRGVRFSNSSSRRRRLSKNASPSIGMTLPLLTSS